jgi:hypothetical protein
MNFSKILAGLLLILLSGCVSLGFTSEHNGPTKEEHPSASSH